MTETLNQTPNNSSTQWDNFLDAPTEDAAESNANRENTSCYDALENHFWPDAAIDLDQLDPTSTMDFVDQTLDQFGPENLQAAINQKANTATIDKPGHSRKVEGIIKQSLQELLADDPKQNHLAAELLAINQEVEKNYSRSDLDGYLVELPSSTAEKLIAKELQAYKYNLNNADYEEDYGETRAAGRERVGRRLNHLQYLRQMYRDTENDLGIKGETRTIGE